MNVARASANSDTFPPTKGAQGAPTRVSGPARTSLSRRSAADSKDYCTTSVTFAVWVSVPLVAMIVNGYVPGFVLMTGLTVSVDELPATGFGVKSNMPGNPTPE